VVGRWNGLDQEMANAPSVNAFKGSIGLSSVLRPRQHSIGYMGDGETKERPDYRYTIYKQMVGFFIG